MLLLHNYAKQFLPDIISVREAIAVTFTVGLSFPYWAVNSNDIFQRLYELDYVSSRFIDSIYNSVSHSHHIPGSC